MQQLSECDKVHLLYEPVRVHATLPKKHFVIMFEFPGRSVGIVRSCRLKPRSLFVLFLFEFPTYT
jgi:hypothetical protein